MRHRREFLSLFLFSIVVRVAWLLIYPRVIENEGAQYARLAQNLFAHRGYVDMRGPVTMISPLYSIFIGTVTLAFRNAELAARVVSLIAGALLPVLIFLVAERIYGYRTACVAGALAAVQPTLVALSASAYSEGLYLMLLMAACYGTLITFEGKHHWGPLLAGVCAGLAYLVKPEGLLYALLFAAWVVVAGWFVHSDLRGGLARSGLSLAISLAVALPFMIFLTSKTGHFQWEGKSPINDNIMLRMNTGLSYPEANTGLGPNLSEDGVALEDDQFVYANTHPVPLSTKLHLIVDGWPVRFLSLLRTFNWAAYLGSPVVWLLALGGLFRGPWTRIRRAHEALLCIMIILLVFVLSTMRFVWSRFLFAILPLILIWAAHGIVALYDWIKTAHVQTPLGVKNYRRVTAFAVPICVSLTMLVVAARDVVRLGEITESRAVEAKAAGLWIASQVPSEEKIVMSVGMVVPYYANSTARVLPYADSSSALLYVHHKEPDFIVLSAEERHLRPYMSSWISEGIPDQCAKLVYRAGAHPDKEIEVYEWICH